MELSLAKGERPFLGSGFIFTIVRKEENRNIKRSRKIFLSAGYWRNKRPTIKQKGTTWDNFWSNPMDGLEQSLRSKTRASLYASCFPCLHIVLWKENRISPQSGPLRAGVSLSCMVFRSGFGDRKTYWIVRNNTIFS